MQSYKLRKTSETVLFPIENELRMLRQENDNNWMTLMNKITSVVFSGIGTTLFCQEEYLPTLLKYLLNKLGLSLSAKGMFILEVLVAILIFVVVSKILIRIISWNNETRDNKKKEQDRENLAEEYHKIILNDIITGISFTKKSKAKLEEMKKSLQEMESVDNKSKKQTKLAYIVKCKRETCLYLAEANYYFVIAKDKMKNKKIIEKGEREDYVKFLDTVGLDTLLESIFMFEAALNVMLEILSDLQNQNEFIWEKKDNELLSIFNNMVEVKKTYKILVNWKINLCDTANALQKKKDIEAEKFFLDSCQKLPKELDERLKKYRKYDKNF